MEMNANRTPVCPVCGRLMEPRIRPWTFRCPKRHLWASNLDVTINVGASAIDEQLREEGLASIRHDNNERVLRTLDGLRPLAASRLLDVGSAHGWFIDAAAQRGAAVSGIEPDRAIADASLLPASTRHGFFPDVLDDRETFDVITFNDVLEHLPDPDAAISQVFAHLAPQGLLSINIPDSRGLAFAIARVAARFGARGPWERLWQRGLPSPHLWYLDAASITRLGERSGLRVIASRGLPAVSRAGLWQRLHMDRKPSAASRIQFVAVVALSPILNLSRFSDILHIVLVKPAD